MAQHFKPNVSLSRRITVFKLAMNTAIFVIAMLAAIVFNMGLLGLLAVFGVNWLANRISDPMSSSSHGIKLGESKIELDHGVKIPYLNIRRVEIMPFVPANYVQQLIWSEHPGNMKMKLHTSQDGEFLLDVSLFSHDDRLAILNTIQDRALNVHVQMPQTA